jgi:hypothetical protein
MKDVYSARRIKSLSFIPSARANSLADLDADADFSQLDGADVGAVYVSKLREFFL